MTVFRADGDLVDIFYCEIALGEGLVLGYIDVDEFIMRVADETALNRHINTMNCGSEYENTTLLMEP